MGLYRRPGEPEDQLGPGLLASSAMTAGQVCGPGPQGAAKISLLLVRIWTLKGESCPFLVRTGTNIRYPTKLDLKYKESDTKKFATTNDTPSLTVSIKGLC